ncbi:hypothetical protein HK101_007309 [Irineochytrium annulatum]|nr:hypothetical protein HK101_007309 [Irineochytrium annulatum]
MADASRLPLYVHCVDGAGVTSVIVMLLRRLQMWRMSCVLSERSRFLGGDGSVEQEEVEFVEGFTGEVDLTECAGGLPRWLWGGRPGFRRHPVMRVKLPPVPGAAPTGDRASISSGPSRPSSRAGPVATWGESGGVDAVPSSIVAGVAGVGAVAGSGGVGSSALSTTSTAEPTIIRPMPSPILTNATLRSVTGGTVVAVGSGATGIPAGGIVAGLQAGAQQMLQQQAVAAGAMSMLSPASDPGQLVVQTGPGLLDPAVRKRVEMQHQQMQMQIQMQQPLRSSSVEPRAIGGGATGGIDLGGAVGTGGEGTGSQIVEGPQAGLAEEPTTVRYHAGRRTEAAEDEMSLTLEALALEM